MAGAAQLWYIRASFWPEELIYVVSIHGTD
ncbi:hypothetical protein SHVI106290_10925 [Shewanella violacea]